MLNNRLSLSILLSILMALPAVARERGKSSRGRENSVTTSSSYGATSGRESSRSRGKRTAESKKKKSSNSINKLVNIGNVAKGGTADFQSKDLKYGSKTKGGVQESVTLALGNAKFDSAINRFELSFTAHKRGVSMLTWASDGRTAPNATSLKKALVKTPKLRADLRNMKEGDQANLTVFLRNGKVHSVDQAASGNTNGAIMYRGPGAPAPAAK